MAAQAGIWYFDGRPVSKAVVKTLTRVNAELGADRHASYDGSGITLLSFAQHFDALAEHEMQPVNTLDQCVLTWDGRLDNRDDFLVRFGAEQLNDRSDAALMAHALGRWHDNVLDQAVGDWSLVRWDSRARRLMLARDYAGNRPLYYRASPHFFAWSTSLVPLVELCELVGQVNERYVARSILNESLLNETCYRDILMVPAGHTVTVNAGAQPVRRRFA